MPYKYFPDQFDDEKVLFLFRKHPVVMRRGLILASVGILMPVLGVFALTFVPDHMPTMNQFYLSIVIGLAVGMILFFPSWLSWHFSVYVVTDQRLLQIMQKGLWRRSMIDIGLDKIQTISYEIRGFQESLLGFGTIVIQTYVGELVIHDVHHPKNIQKRMSHILREQGVITLTSPVND